MTLSGQVWGDGPAASANPDVFLTPWKDFRPPSGPFEDHTGAVFDGVKRVFVGRPLHSDRMEGTLLPKRVALAVFCSDPISSVAYATEQILLVLAAGGLAALATAPWVALAVILLLVTVVAS